MRRSSKKLPAVTVMMPAYNAEKYIRNAIESVLKQAFSNFELIIIDDRSQDKTYEIAYSFKGDARIRLYRNRKQCGEAWTRNRILRLAKGRYIVPHDADDVMLQGRLKAQFEFLEARPDFILVTGKYLLMDKSAKELVGAITPKDPFQDMPARSGPLARCPNNVGVCGAMIRRRAMMACGGFDESLRYGTDSDFMRRLSRCGKFYYQDRFSFIYRLYASSSLRSFVLSSMHAMRKAMRTPGDGKEVLRFSVTAGRRRVFFHIKGPFLVKLVKWRMAAAITRNGQAAVARGRDIKILLTPGARLEKNAFERDFLAPLGKHLAGYGLLLVNAALLAGPDGKGILLLADEKKSDTVAGLLAAGCFYLSGSAALLYESGGKIFGCGLWDTLLLEEVPSGLNQKLKCLFWNERVNRYCLRADLWRPHMMRQETALHQIIALDGKLKARRSQRRALSPAELRDRMSTLIYGQCGETAQARLLSLLCQGARPFCWQGPSARLAPFITEGVANIGGKP